MPRRSMSSCSSKMNGVRLAAPCVEADKGETVSTGHGTQTLTRGNEGSATKKRSRDSYTTQWLNGKNVDNMTTEELKAEINEMWKCKPDCTCNSCRPDLDLKRLRKAGRLVQVDGKDYVRYIRDNLEVFTVKFLDFIGLGGRVRGNMWIPLLSGVYKLFGPDTARPPCIEIDENGLAELADADCPLDAEDCLAIFIKLQKHDGEEPACEMKIEECVGLLWSPYNEPVHKALRKQLETELGPVEVTFAIIENAVPAHVEVCLLDWTLEQDDVSVHGEITVGNKNISDQNAVSYLFQKSPKCSVLVRRSLEEGAGAPLPLSKNCTSVSFNSALQISIKLKRCFNESFRWIAQDTLEFSVNPGNSERQIIKGNDFRLAVTITWTPDELQSFEERTKNFARMRAAKK